MESLPRVTLGTSAQGDRGQPTAQDSFERYGFEGSAAMRAWGSRGRVAQVLGLGTQEQPRLERELLLCSEGEVEGDGEGLVHAAARRRVRTVLPAAAAAAPGRVVAWKSVKGKVQPHGHLQVNADVFFLGFSSELLLEQRRTQKAEKLLGSE